MKVKATPCELLKENGRPLSRYSGQDLVRNVVRRGIVAQISGRTRWRWLGEDAIGPWQRRSWIFPRAPDFRTKAERVLDLYQGFGKANLWVRPIACFCRREDSSAA